MEFAIAILNDTKEALSRDLEYAEGAEREDILTRLNEVALAISVLEKVNSKDKDYEEDLAWEKYRQTVYEASRGDKFCECEEPARIYNSSPDFCAKCGEEIKE